MYSRNLLQQINNVVVYIKYIVFMCDVIYIYIYRHVCIYELVCCHCICIILTLRIIMFVKLQISMQKFAFYEIILFLQVGEHNFL